MLLMIEKGIREGTSMISNRYGKANNSYMNKKYDPNKPTKYIVYLDENNLYGWAMMKSLPVGASRARGNQMWKYSPILVAKG